MELVDPDFRGGIVTIEFVALPSTFNIDNHLSMRESVNQFMNQKITLKNVRLISQSIVSTPVFSISSVSVKVMAAALMVLTIIKELNLSVERVSSWLSKNSSYKDLLQPHGHWFTDDEYGDRSSISKGTLVIVNLYQLIEQGILNDVIEKVVEIEDYANSVTESVKDGKKMKLD